MRYTTLIDISEDPSVYGNVNARLLYLHMVLKAGYHDQDRDTLRISLRQLASAVGITLSATRHALGQLQRAQLVSKEGDIWRIVKWVAVAPPTPRRQANTARTEAGKASIGQQYDEQLKEWQQKVLAAVRASTREELEAWLEELQQGRSLNHRGVYLKPNKNNIEWLKSIISKV